jgi:hypothetical protein
MKIRDLLKAVGSVDRVLDSIRGEYPEDTDADGNVYLSEEEARKYLPPEKLAAFLEKRRRALRK